MKKLLFVILAAFLLLPACKESLKAEKNKNYVMKAVEIQLGTLLSVTDNKKFTKNIPSDFRFNLNNREISFKELTKGKNVILNFWGTWCGVCLSEMPGLIEISNDYKAKNWIVIGILKEKTLKGKEEDIYTRFKRVSRALDELGIPFINIVGSDKLMEELKNAYGGFSGAPFWVFINSSGKIFRSTPGGFEKNVIELLMNDK